MRWIMMLIWTLVFVDVANASTVLWNVVTKDTTGEYPSLRVAKNDSPPYFLSGFHMSVDVFGDRAVMTANPGATYMLSYAGAWLQADYGEIVNADSTLHAPAYFEYGLLGNGTASEESIIANVNLSNYLKFVLQDGEQCFDYQDGKRTAMPDCFYGWVEYRIDTEGNLEVLASAIDIDGDSIIVGVGTIPEPLGGVLLILGLAELALRRKRNQSMRA